MSLWADPLGDGVLRTVRGTKLLILQDNGSAASVGDVGELMIAGPMVGDSCQISESVSCVLLCLKNGHKGGKCCIYEYK